MSFRFAFTRRSPALSKVFAHVCVQCEKAAQSHALVRWGFHTHVLAFDTKWPVVRLPRDTL